MQLKSFRGLVQREFCIIVLTQSCGFHLSFWISLLSVEIITSLFQSMTVQSQATNPNLAILADRKEWRIKTIGLGQECKSSCCEWGKKKVLY